ncbi:hypothetical protein ACFL1Z_07005 [Thermodesulfobacteriota bacterium]
MAEGAATSIQGLFLLVDRKTEEGFSRWLSEIERRKMPALIMADGYTMAKNPNLIKRSADMNLDLGVVYNDGALWEETYDDMITWIPSWMNIEKVHLKKRKDVEREMILLINKAFLSITGITMPVFSGKYFSYNENTLTIADEIGIKYILARGTEQERAVFYQSYEYKTAIISVSNVPSKELGTGSLCDESLESRGESADDFKKLLSNLNPDRIILVAQTHVSGLKNEWWEAYQDYFDSGRVEWNDLNSFITDAKTMPFEDIPVNKRVEYMKINLEKAKEAGEMV